MLPCEDKVERLNKLLQRSDVQELMAERCIEQGHEYENCCSIMLQVYQQCKWCNRRR